MAAASPNEKQLAGCRWIREKRNELGSGSYGQVYRGYDKVGVGMRCCAASVVGLIAPSEQDGKEIAVKEVSEAGLREKSGGDKALMT